jgi:hypothetical protein
MGIIFRSLFQSLCYFSIHPPKSFTNNTMSDNNLQWFFMGTGTSTGLPLAPCLTLSSNLPPDVSDIKTNGNSKSKSAPLLGQYNPNGPWPKNVTCGSCRSAVDPDVPEGYKNKRGNTSMVIRKKVEGKWFNVVLDVGKTFRENANRYFPVWGVQTIDAVILTHGRKLIKWMTMRDHELMNHRCRCLFRNGRFEGMVYSAIMLYTGLSKSTDL